MAKLTEDEIDDLQYFARMGDIEEFNALKDELCKREKVNMVGLLEVAKDELSGNGSCQWSSWYAAFSPHLRPNRSIVETNIG
jgi:hypothetical protein